MPGELLYETAARAENRPSNVHLMGMLTGRNGVQEVAAPFQEQEPARRDGLSRKLGLHAEIGRAHV